jgi:alkylhydroperoxidase/carboxymuconolactone decarboxylase family protein YurZ
MSQKIAKHYQMVKDQFPEYLDAVERLGEVVKDLGPIDEKRAQLLQLAASVAIKSEGATHSHTKRALEAGASKSEIRHAVLLLSNTIGFPAVMAGLTWVNDVLET